MVKNSWRILLVDDNEDDYMLTRILLSEAKGESFTLEWAPDYAHAIKAVEGNHIDAILLDYYLGPDNGLNLAREMVNKGVQAPIILLTGEGNYEIDLEAMRSGVADYLNKNEVTSSLLERTIRYAIESNQTRAELLNANKRLASINELLAEAKNELEYRVAERTQDLSEANEELSVMNEELLTEIDERKRIEQELRNNSARIEKLADLSALLAEATPNFQRMLDTITRSVSETIGVACIVSLLSEDQQEIRTVSVYHPDQEEAEYLRESLVAKVHPSREGLRGEVIRTGKPLVISSHEEWLEKTGIVDAQTNHKYNIHSLVIVPLRAQGKSFGTLGVSRDEPGKPYNHEELIFLEDLATRIGLAITSARYFQKIQNELAERQRVESELAEYQRRLIESIETERLQFAQDLHDGPMQDLYGLSYQIEALQEETGDQLDQESFDSLREKLQQVIQSLRSIAGELRPPSLAPFGLEKAIRSHVEHIQQVQPELKIQLDLMPDGKILPEPVRLALFRIYQVAITNVIRHSQAKRAVVRFNLDEEKVILDIQDDGCGFEPPRRLVALARQGHLGLVGAFERAQAIGGKLSIQSQPGQGTLIRVIVPRETEGDNLWSESATNTLHTPGESPTSP